MLMGLKKFAIDKVKYFSYFLIILVPIVMIGRVHHRWDETKQVPDELLYHAEQQIIYSKEWSWFTETSRL